MSKEICAKTIRFSCKTYQIGQAIEIDDADEVTRLKDLGALVVDAVAETETTNDSEDEPATLAQIVDAIGRLDEDGLNKDGSPSVTAVRDLLGDLTVEGSAIKEAVEYIALQNKED